MAAQEVEAEDWLSVIPWERLRRWYVCVCGVRVVCVHVSRLTSGTGARDIIGGQQDTHRGDKAPDDVISVEPVWGGAVGLGWE